MAVQLLEKPDATVFGIRIVEEDAQGAVPTALHDLTDLWLESRPISGRSHDISEVNPIGAKGNVSNPEQVTTKILSPQGLAPCTPVMRQIDVNLG